MVMSTTRGLGEIKGLATKEDLAAAGARLETKIEAAKNEMLRWLSGADDGEADVQHPREDLEQHVFLGDVIPDGIADGLDVAFHRLHLGAVLDDRRLQAVVERRLDLDDGLVQRQKVRLVLLRGHGSASITAAPKKGRPSSPDRSPGIRPRERSAQSPRAAGGWKSMSLPLYHD